MRYSHDDRIDRRDGRWPLRGCTRQRRHQNKIDRSQSHVSRKAVFFGLAAKLAAMTRTRECNVIVTCS